MSELKKSIVKVKVHNKEYLCDTAIDDWEREHGFMHIESLSENQGLLFIYPEVQEEVNYWMKDTPLYLDIIFISPEFKVISNKEGKPNDTSIISEKNVLFVLEVSNNSGIRSGESVEFEGLDEVLEERLDYLEDLEDESPKDTIENDIDDLEDLLEILSTNGKVQYKIKGGERIFSRKNTRVLIRQAKKAEKLKTDSAYKRLGKSVFKYMKIQDNNDPEYINTEKHG